MHPIGFVLLPLATCLMLLSACSPPPAGVHEVLRVSEQGEFNFKGVPVPRAQLRAVLAAEKRQQGSLYAEIAASPKANMESVRFAIETLKAEEVRFSFRDERVMTSGKAMGAPAE